MLKKIRKSQNAFAYTLLAPSIILLVALIGYPMIYNIMISVQKVPLNPKLESVFVGLDNFKEVLADKEFYSSVLITIAFTFVVVVLSTILGLAMACFLNREFVGKKLVNALVILSYVVPSVCLIFCWRYMFNNIYGIINYFLVDILHVVDKAPLWFDSPVSAFVLVALFNVWRFFPYAYMSFVAIMTSIDKSLYEAADIDGASKWQKFKAVTYPAIKPTMVTVVSLRMIWAFYIYAEVKLLTSQVDVLGVYLYDMAFSTHNFGKAAAISLVLFVFIFAMVMLIRTIIPKSFTFKHMEDIFNPGIFPFLKYFKNSMYISLTTSAIVVFLGILGGYALAKLKFKGKSVITEVFFFVYMFSGILLIVPLYKLLSSIGLRNSHEAVIICMIIQTLPTAIYMTRSFFETIPDELEEAGRVDGLSRFGVIFRIVVPLSISGLISVFVYAFMIAWNDVLFASIFLDSPDKMTITIGLNSLFNTPDYIWGRMMAASIMSSLPIVIMYGISQTLIKSGRIAGGVKG